jgi:Family of unknown function (DUF6461)
VNDEAADVIARFGWVHRFVPSCMSVTRDRPPRDVLTAVAHTIPVVFGPDTVEAADRWFEDEDSDLLPSVIWAVRIGEWTVAVEENGWQASTDEVALALSEGTESVVYYWSGDAVMRFLVVKDGSIVRRFDPLLDYDNNSQPRRGTPLPQEAGLPFGIAAHEAALALIERLTGVTIEPSLRNQANEAIGIYSR